MNLDVLLGVTLWVSVSVLASNRTIRFAFGKLRTFQEQENTKHPATFRIKFMVVLALSLLPSAALAETFQYPAEGFAITLPGNWTEIPHELLRSTFAQVYSQVERQAGSKTLPEWDYAFQTSDAQDWFQYPYVLIRVRKTGRLSVSQLESRLAGFDAGSAEQELTRDLSGLIRGPEVGQFYYDRTTNITWATLRVEIPGGGSVDSISSIIPTEVGYIEVAAYATSDTFEKWGEVFSRVISNLEVSEKIRYKRRLLDGVPVLDRIDWGEAAFQGVMGGIIGAVIALLVGVRMFRNRRRG